MCVAVNEHTSELLAFFRWYPSSKLRDFGINAFAAVSGGGPGRVDVCGWSLEEMSLPIPSSTDRLTEVPTPDSNELPVEFVASPMQQKYKY